VESLGDCFAADAVGHDEGRAIRGLDAIKAWRGREDQVHYISKLWTLVQDQATVTMRARLSGSSLVAPIEVTYVHPGQ